jgi:3-oxoacyl-[acyl-carrier protein] reductase
LTDNAAVATPLAPHRPLTGEVALVTGSGRGLGYAVAERLAELGAAVAVHDINQDAPREFGEHRDLDDVAAQIAARFGVPAAPVTADIADEEAVNAMARHVEHVLGPITILVNCAGGDIALRGGKPQPNNALEIPLEDARSILDRNLLGTMLACRAVAPECANGAGAPSSTSPRAPPPGRHQRRRLRRRQGRHHPLVQLPCRRFAQTRRAREHRSAPARPNRPLPRHPHHRPAKLDESQPLARYATPSEVADAIVMLCGPDARFVTGQTLRVDGGSSL